MTDDLIGDGEVGAAKAAPGGPAIFTPAHGWIVLGLYAVASGIAFLASGSGSPADLADRSRLLMALGAIAGPFEGSIARHHQSCCLDFSTRLAAQLCGPALLLGVAFQFVPPRWTGGLDRPTRLAAWTLGWLVWFLGIPVSLLHAFG